MVPPTWGNGRTVRTLRWRLVDRFDGSRGRCDLANDPRKCYDVCRNLEHEPLVKRLHAMLEKEFGPRPKAQKKLTKVD